MILMILIVLDLCVVEPDSLLSLIIPPIVLASMFTQILSLRTLPVPVVSLILVLECTLLLIIHLILVGIVWCTLISPCFMLVLKTFVYVGLCGSSFPFC